MTSNEQTDKGSLRWKQFETPIALLLSVIALVVSILSYRNSTALRYNLSVGMPPTAPASLTEVSTGVSADIVYRGIADKSLGLSRVAVLVEVSITSLGSRPFSIERLSAWPRLELSNNADTSVTPDSLPFTFDKVYDQLSNVSGRRLNLPLLVEPGNQKRVRVKLEIPLVDAIAKYVFREKKSVSTEVFCARFERKAPELFNGNQRFLGEFLDPELFVQIAQKTDSDHLPIPLCYADVVEAGEDSRLP